MSLSGNLGFVSLDEVLRLLTRSHQQGSVDVLGEGVHGRIFITKAGIALATTSDDAGMHRHLVKSGLVDEDHLRRAESGETTLAPIFEKSGGAIVDLLREMTVESIYQLGLNGESFEVTEGKATTYASPEPFELESLLADSKQRLTEWTEVSQTVKDLQGVMRFRRDLGDREQVDIDRDEWQVLSELGSGSSVTQVAEELGTTEFWTARVSARLVRRDLIGFEREAVEPVVGPEVEVWATPVEERDISVDPNQSWWEEPAKEKPPADEDHVAEDAPEDDRQEEAWGPVEQTDVPAHDEESASGEVEEDTEAFLEKVFSELDSSSGDDGEGYGLLRRRRMGAMRDVSGE